MAFAGGKSPLPPAGEGWEGAGRECRFAMRPAEHHWRRDKPGHGGYLLPATAMKDS